MSWQKLGHVYVASGERDWQHSHAYLPTTVLIDGEIRVFVAFLDRNGVGRIGFVDVDAADPTRVLRVSEDPVLDVGRPGTFDDNGVSPIAIARDDEELLLFYVGWQLGVRVRYYLFAGLATADATATLFHRVSEVPLLDRSDGELFFRTAPSVMYDEGRWKMWYIAGDAWVDDGSGKAVPTYDMRYLESDTPRSWPHQGRVVLSPRPPDEVGFGRPHVRKRHDRFNCWYSIRSRTHGYRIGYAESHNGLDWSRLDDQAGLSISTSGWDSEMVCFPWIQETPHGTFMFYNGNNYGEAGFGVAALEG